ncbi:beta-ketoacyl synthase chain length factor [Lacimicrobium sp. SS2-24]|uniref:beta-ketoacyl synthase chain length factor n=1 Tax=Lacimicrobium sp. SS2-24 TaxID=2005569 RepID=UPI000B4A62DA|nr:beta-ketoacyl synthase chain length factor [Lacimicrobium sp. SS2-24]
MDFFVHNLSLWSLGDAGYKNNDVNDPIYPNLDWVPAMQRRRLSALTKMALFTAAEAMQNCESEVETVFATRHGDLHKTLTLLNCLTEEEALSPTTFSLSVHNAVSGLFSIFTGNKAASNTVSAGAHSFLMGLVEAVVRARLTRKRVLLVYMDQALPEIYKPFDDESLRDHSLAMLISAERHANQYCHLHLQPANGDGRRTMGSPESLAFARWWQGDVPQLQYTGPRYDWQVRRYA